MVLASISQYIGLRQRIYTRGYFTKDIAGLSISSDIEYLSIAYVWDYQLRLYQGRKLRRQVSTSEPTSPSIVTVLVTIPSTKQSAAASRGLARQYQKGIQIHLRVVSIFLVARLTIYYIKSIIYIISLDIIREPITITAKLDGVQVY